MEGLQECLPCPDLLCAYHVAFGGRSTALEGPHDSLPPGAAFLLPKFFGGWLLFCHCWCPENSCPLLRLLDRDGKAVDIQMLWNCSSLQPCLLALRAGAEAS
ncbi:Hypothetical predicted protein [Podarcis lilfordi]|uniref:Uncharacterized protein n=1 Tax=Podarcis lilfordi TaxID=74358 RepID=A0AA35PPM9_9SAUR|nr:Hypothetical predicted protein [Podarcis lilfordi]